MKIARDRLFYLIAFALLFLSLGLRIFLTFHRRFNADEFQHLHASWMVHSGYFPYRDFWENHTPLLYYLLAPAFSLFDEQILLIFFLRVFMSASALIVVGLTYRLARLYHDRLTSLLAAVALSFSVLFLQKTIEIRPDQFLVGLWLGSLLICLRQLGVERNSVYLIFAGLLLGIGMLFSPKALLCLAAAILTFVAYFATSFARNFKTSFLRAGRSSFLYILGFLIPVAICAFFFWKHNSLDLFLQRTLLENLNYPYTRRPVYLLSLQHLVFFLLGLAGLLLLYLDQNSYKLANGRRFLLAVPCLFLLLIFVIVLPSPFPQSALVFVPLLAIYAGVAMNKSVQWLVVPGTVGTVKRKLFVVFIFIGGVITPCVSVLIKQPSTTSNAEQLRLLHAVLDDSDRSDVFFDGNAAYIFRPQAYYYGSLVEAIRDRMRSWIAEDIIRSMKQRQCKFVIYDDRVSQLPGTIQEFIRNHYIPTETPTLLIAGRHLSADNISGRTARFWIEIPLLYEIEVRNSDSFVVNGRPYQSAVFLKRGAHMLVAEEPLQQVTVRAARRSSW